MVVVIILENKSSKIVIDLAITVCVWLIKAHTNVIDIVVAFFLAFLLVGVDKSVGLVLLDTIGSNEPLLQWVEITIIVGVLKHGALKFIECHFHCRKRVAIKFCIEKAHFA